MDPNAKPVPYGRTGGDAYVEGPDRVIFMHSCDLPGDDGQCLACGFSGCPNKEPRHFHPQGCPRCQSATATVRPYSRGHIDHKP